MPCAPITAASVTARSALGTCSAARPSPPTTAACVAARSGLGTGWLLSGGGGGAFRGFVGGDAGGVCLCLCGFFTGGAVRGGGQAGHHALLWGWLPAGNA